MPKPPALGNLVVEEQDTQASYSFSNCGRELFFRAYMFRNGTIFLKDGSSVDSIKEDDLAWEEKKFVGRGVSGSVYCVPQKVTGRPLAVKSISITTKTHRDEVSAELSVLTAAHNSNHIVRTFGAFWESDGNSVAIVMEWMAYSLFDLLSFCRGLEESIVRDVTVQLLLGGRYLHEERRVIHRDVKPKNVLVGADGLVKFSDFGIAKAVCTMNNTMMSYVGTELYMAPERLDQGGYSFASDIWSIGLTIQACSTGASPWPQDLSVFALVMKMQKGETPKFPQKYSADAHDFLANCLVVDPEKRSTCSQLLEHPWMKGHTVEKARENLKVLLPMVSGMATNAETQQKETGSAPPKASELLNSDLFAEEED